MGGGQTDREGPMTGLTRLTFLLVLLLSRHVLVVAGPVEVGVHLVPGAQGRGVLPGVEDLVDLGLAGVVEEVLLGRPDVLYGGGWGVGVPGVEDEGDHGQAPLDTLRLGRHEVDLDVLAGLDDREVHRPVAHQAGDVAVGGQAQGGVQLGALTEAEQQPEGQLRGPLLLQGHLVQLVHHPEAAAVRVVDLEDPVLLVTGHPVRGHPASDVGLRKVHRVYLDVVLLVLEVVSSLTSTPPFTLQVLISSGSGSLVPLKMSSLRAVILRPISSRFGYRLAGTILDGLVSNFSRRSFGLFAHKDTGLIPSNISS